jgi:hypothetical protein
MGGAAFKGEDFIQAGVEKNVMQTDEGSKRAIADITWKLSVLRHALGACLMA